MVFVAEVGTPPADLDPVEPTRDMCLVIVPADLAGGDDVQARLRLFADHLDGDLVLHPRQLLGGDLPAVEAGYSPAQAGRSRPVGYLGVAPYGCRLHLSPRLCHRRLEPQANASIASTARVQCSRWSALTSSRQRLCPAPLAAHRVPLPAYQGTALDAGSSGRCGTRSRRVGRTRSGTSDPVSAPPRLRHKGPHPGAAGLRRPSSTLSARS